MRETPIELVKDWDKSAPWLPYDATDIQIKEVKQYGPGVRPGHPPCGCPARW
jgi:hypothetical protein